MEIDEPRADCSGVLHVPQKSSHRGPAFAHLPLTPWSAVCAACQACGRPGPPETDAGEDMHACFPCPWAPRTQGKLSHAEHLLADPTRTQETWALAHPATAKWSPKTVSPSCWEPRMCQGCPWPWSPFRERHTTRPLGRQDVKAGATQRVSLWGPPRVTAGRPMTGSSR